MIIGLPRRAILVVLSIVIVSAVFYALNITFPDKYYYKGSQQYNAGEQQQQQQQQHGLARFTCRDVNDCKFGYVQYVTDLEYLCAAVMSFSSLSVKTSADLILLHSSLWSPDGVKRLSDEQLDEVSNPMQGQDESDKEYFTRIQSLQEQRTITKANRLLEKARNEFNVKLIPVDIMRIEGLQDTTWRDSFTKLQVFKQSEYDRLVFYDADSIIHHAMDELFFLPSATIAMPRAYWLDFDEASGKFSKNKFTWSDQLMVVEPSNKVYELLMSRAKERNDNEYDMDIVNHVFDPFKSCGNKQSNITCLLLPHRVYDFLSGELRQSNHLSLLEDPDPNIEQVETYKSIAVNKWDANQIFTQAKFIHFSDWPIDKPWLDPVDKINAPQVCSDEEQSDEGKDCVAMQLWHDLYSDFSNRRREICDYGDA